MNHLKTAKSLYLKQHQDNPVDWHAWSEDIFKRAKAENKPILLSSGYSACHWCHVMAHESFEDKETAALMNNNFINVKLDREERPDIDYLYQQALNLMGEPGGWPLTMFLDTDGQPFFGGTYFPPKPMFGRPSFKTILQGIAKSWQDGEDAIAHNAAALMQGLKEESQIASKSETPKQGDVENALLKLVSGFDPKFGGFGTEPKFPQIPMLRAILQSTQVIKTPDNTSLDMDVMRHIVSLTLYNISQGGIYDHVNGGLFRYATDQQWRIPHFEKMLCDNALYALALCGIYQTNPDRLYEARIKETLKFLNDNMYLGPDIGFAAALDADDQDGEGGFYTFTEDEIDTAIAKNAKNDLLISDDFKRTYDVTKKGNWPEKPGRNILNRTQHQQLFADQKENAFQTILSALKDHKKIAPKPMRDEKVLTDWNAMAICAFLKAGLIFKNKKWIDIAKEAYQALSVKDLPHCVIDGEKTSSALLDDYAWMITAALDMYEITGRDAYLDDAIGWMTIVLRDFHDQDKGGFFTSSKNANDVPQNVKTISDTSTPSGNALILSAIHKLAVITKDDVLKKRVEDGLKCFVSDLSNAPHAVGGYISAILSYLSETSLELHAPNAEDITDWAINVKEKFGDKVYISYVPSENTAGVICVGQKCLPPVKDIKALQSLLEEHLT